MTALFRPYFRITWAAALLFCAFGLPRTGCDKSESSGTTTPTTGSSAGGGGTLTVGFIFVGGKDDYGYNQAHHEGAEVVKAEPGVKVLEEEKVPETLDVQKTMESMINLDGATVLFPTSFGYFDPHILKMAE